MATADSDQTAEAPELPQTIDLQINTRLIVVFILFLGFAHNAWVTWDKLGDLVVDVGRELDTPKQLAAGKVLYRDVRYWYGPLAPYLNAGLYRVFGVHQRTLQFAGLACAGIMTLLVYRIARLFAGRLGATACALAIIYINLFGHYYGLNIFNYVMPYAYPATYGITAAMGSLYFLLRHVRDGKPSDFVISGGCLALAALAKVEVLFATAVMHFVFLAIWARYDRKRPMFLFGTYGAVVFVVAAVYGMFYALTGPGLWRDNLFTEGNLNAGLFLKRSMGLEHAGAAMGEIGESAMKLGGCFLVLLGVGYWSRAISGGRRTSDASGIAWIPGVVAAVVCGALVYLMVPTISLRAMPIIMLLSLVVAVVTLIRFANHRESKMHIVLLVFALALIAKMPLRAGAEHYGFYLAVPSILALGILVCGTLPRLMARGRSGAGQSVVIGGGAMLMVLSLTHFALSRATDQWIYGARAAAVVRTAYGTLPCATVQAGTMDAAIQFFAGLPPTTKLVVVPEGAGVTFLAGLTNPLGMHTFLPVDLCGSYTDEAIRARLEAADPDYIFFDARDTEEYGKKGFGQDYALITANWILQHYRIIKQLQTPHLKVTIFGK